MESNNWAQRGAEQLHEWYLEAVNSLEPQDGLNDFNPNAVKPYSELSEGQQYLDKYIADKVSQELEKAKQEGFNLGKTKYLMADAYKEAREEGRQEVVHELLHLDNDEIITDVKLIDYLIRQQERQRLLGLIDEMKRPEVAPGGILTRWMAWNAGLEVLKNKLK